MMDGAPPPDLVLRSRNTVLPDGIGPASVFVRGGVVAAVDDVAAPAGGAREIDAGDSVLMPGLVDTHVHLNEPGRTEWEGFETGTAAAAAGGVTTLVEMPLNAIPATVSAAALAAKRAAAEGRCRVDVGFWGGVVPGNAAELPALWEAGAFGFKCFLAPSGVEEFPAVSEADLRRAMPVLAELGAPLLVHAELTSAGDAETVPAGDPRRYETYLRTRPPRMEVDAVALLVRLCREFGTRVHVVHVAAAEALPLLHAARAEGLPITAETCPHYLYFAAEDVPDGATEFKCAPPIRGDAARDALWRALGTGVLDVIASDHSPAPPALKCRDSGDFLAAWGGIASLQLGLPAIWSRAREHGYTAGHLAAWMCAAPARLAGLGHRKGAIAPGMDADFVVWNPHAHRLVEPMNLFHRHKLSPYVGAILPGVVEATFLRGECIYDGAGFPAAPTGRVLLRGTA
jgi:allantoinase